MTNEDEDTLDVTLNDNVDARLNFHVVDCMVDKTYPHWIFLRLDVCFSEIRSASLCTCAATSM